MVRTSDEFTILPLGYEHTTPMLAQYQHHVQIKQVLENLRNAPDFALLSTDRTRVFLAEVKYRRAPGERGDPCDCSRHAGSMESVLPLRCVPAGLLLLLVQDDR